MIAVCDAVGISCEFESFKVMNIFRSFNLETKIISSVQCDILNLWLKWFVFYYKLLVQIINEFSFKPKKSLFILISDWIKAHLFNYIGVYGILAKDSFQNRTEQLIQSNGCQLYCTVFIVMLHSHAIFYKNLSKVNLLCMYI